MSNFTAQERDFVRRMVGRARVTDIAAVLGRSKSRVLHYAADFKLPGCKRSGHEIMGRAALALLWRAEKQGRSTPAGADLILDSRDSRKKLWTSAEEAELMDCAALEPLADIAARLGRTVQACKERLKACGQGSLPYRYQVSKFPAALKAHNGMVVAANTVASWVYRGQVRSFKQCGNARCLHADDWDWLLDNWQFREIDWAALKRDVWEMEVEEFVPVEHKPERLALSDIARRSPALGRGMADTIHAACVESGKTRSAA